METQSLETAVQAAGAITALMPIVLIVTTVFFIIVMWKIFSKAGEPGWASIVPIYNVIVMLRIACKPGWWFFLLLIPGVNVIISIIVLVGMARSFGKGIGFAIGMMFLSFIFYPILAFGSAEFVGISGHEG